MKLKRFTLVFLALALAALQAMSQSIANGYSVGTWSGFRTAAASFTFDDNAPSHVSAVAPAFKERGYCATFNVVINWMDQSNQWSSFKNLVKDGHEIASHTVTHSQQTSSEELSSSKSTINQNITGQDCNTIAYPYCNVPSDANALAQNYIGGRICDGQVMGKTPSDYFRISAITTGNEANFTSTSDFTNSMQSAINKSGWVVFLTHGIQDQQNGNATYSPTPLSAITGALDWAKTNDSKIWVTTFRNAILYAKERDALSLAETTESSKLKLTASVNITSSVVDYTYPITVRRQMPNGWTNFAAATNNTDIEVKIVTVGSTKYAQFDVIPGKTYYLEDRESEYTNNNGGEEEDVTFEELISNGEFDSGTSGWQTQTGGNAQLTMTATTSAGLSGANAVSLCPNGNYGSENWHIQMYQNVNLEPNVDYTLKFSAKGASARKLYVMVQKIAAEYDTYFYKEYDLTTTGQEYEEAITTPADVAADSKVTFCIGGADGCVYIDKVSFGYEKSNGGGGGGGDNPHYDVDITGDISKYFIDKGYVGPSCDALEGESVTEGAYFTGEYPNLFVKYLGVEQSDVDKKMQKVFNQLFNPNENVGDRENNGKTVYYEVNGNMAYIYAPDSKDVRTEGMSYGMMICVQMGDQDKFDKIWRWAKKYMQYPKGDAREGIFAWQCNTDGSIKGASCAPDGEMYFLTALWFASHRWGNEGDINYEGEAQYLAKRILALSGQTNNGQVRPLFNSSNHIVTFGETSYNFTDPSYNLPGFLELWARWSDTNKDFWKQTPAAARGLLRNSCHSTSGLYPDYSQFDGSPYKPDWAGYNTERYQYDACRSAMNVGMDYNWFKVDNTQPAMTERTLKFFQKDGFSHCYFNWDGSGAEGQYIYNQAVRGSNGAAALALENNDNLAKTYVQDLWDTQTPSGLYRYYNGMVYFLGMLHTAGYFKIYKPCPEVIEENLAGPAPVEFNGEEYSKDTTFKTLIDCKIYDVTITIEAAANKYTVSFVDYDDSEITSVEVEEGEAATAPDDPTREGYDFAEWDTDFSNVTTNLTVKATYTIKTFTVAFVDYDDSPIGTAQTIEYGQSATAPTAPTREHFTFKEWDTDFSSVKANLTVKAVYEENAKADYTALNEAIALAESKDEEEFTAASWSTLQTALTAAQAVDKNLYVEEQSVVDDATTALTAAITALVEQTYTVTFVDWDDSPIGDAQTVKKGGSATAPANPTREGYTFIGWDKEFSNVTEDLTVKATYNKKDAGSKYEAENAQGNGTQTVSNNAASGGKYVKMVEGSLTFTVNVETAGMYTAKFAYSLTEKYKAQYLSVNGSQVGSVSFDQSGTNNPTFATVEVCVMLNAGSNTIALTKSWGYVDIDYLEISSYDRVQFNIDEALVTPNPQPATVEVYEFLKDNFGQKTISGVMTLDLLSGNNTLPLASQSEVSYINSNSGKSPALVGFDFMHSTGQNSTNDWQKAYTRAALEMAEELWNAGGIPTFSWHWRDPNQNGNDFYTDKTSFDLTNAFTNSSYTEWNTNSTEYKNMIKDIDIIAGYLKQLQCAGVSILWRPIHEASGAWFWWGAKGAEPYKQLYKLLFDRLVNYHHLNNLIWVWNSDGTDADWYPGDAYVDVVGRDFYYGDDATYNHSSLVTDFEALAKQTNGKKLITLAENGAVPYPENMDNDDAMWSWFMPWYGEYVTESKHNTASDWNTIMNDSRVITLSDMGGWDNRTKVYDTTTVGTLYAKNGFSVTPSAEGDSEHEITLKSVNDCDSVVVLYLHANAAAIVTYTVTFVDYDGTTLKTEEVESGKSATAPTAPTREHYTFKEWDTDFSNVTSDLTVTAVYEENAKADYTALNAAIAQAEGLTEDDYTAETWSALQTALTAAKAVDKDLYAEDQATIDAATSALTSAINALAEQTYTVTFLGKDGNELKKETVKKGESATAPEAPEIDGFTFSGWLGSFENVTADVTITAQYTEKGKADYTALNAAIAQAETLNEDDYTAQSWSSLQTALTNAKAVDKDLYAESQSVVDAATEALTSAINALVEQTYIVTFLGKEGNELKKQTVKKGESATAPEAPEIDGFTFSGWSGSFENVTADVTVTASYTENGKAVYTELDNAILAAEALTQAEYTESTWSAVASALEAAKAVNRNLYVDDQNIVDAATSALTSAMSGLVVKTFTVTFTVDGSEVSSQTIEYGKNATAPTTPTKEGYDFVAWNGDYTNVTADVTIVAEFAIKTFTIKFVDWDGTELSVQTIEYGNNAVPPSAPSREGYTFQEWVGTYQNVTADAIVVANYTELSKANYTALDQAIAAAKAKVQTDYTNDSWAVLQSALTSAEAVDRNLLAENQSEIDQATTALNVAIGALVLQTYTVKFVVDGEVVSTQEVTPNAAAVAPSTPVKLGYNFDHWDKDFSSVTEDMTITAIFTVKTFTVKFVDWNNAILSNQTVEYGASATAPANPTREGYIFDGWNGSYENVVSNVTITAIYTEKGKASYTELDRTIASVANLREADYAMNTWIALQQALTQANAVDRNLFEEQQQIVDNANTTLENAINALERLDRTTLATTIATANSLYSGAVEGQNKDQYPSGSKTMLLNAINEATAVYETVSLTQIDLNIAVQQLQDAIDLFNSLKITADKSKLVMTIAKANSTMARANGNMGDGSGQYPIAAVAVFQTAINEAQQTYETATIQEVVDNQVTILTNAIEAFLASANPITVDKSKLEEIIAIATNLLNTTSPGDKPGQYPYLEYMDLFSARISANEILAKDNPRQEDVDIQVVVLRNAIDAYINSKIPDNVSVGDIAENQVVIYTKSHVIVVENAENQKIEIFDIDGRRIETIEGDAYTELKVEKCGMYVVKVGKTQQKVVVK